MKRVHIAFLLQIFHCGNTGCPDSKSSWAHCMPKSLSHLITTVLDPAGIFPHPGVKISTNLCSILVLLVVVGQWVIQHSNWPPGSTVHFFLNLFIIFLRFLFLCKKFLFSLLPTIAPSCTHMLLPLFLPFLRCTWCCSGGGTKSRFLFSYQDEQLALNGACFQREVHVSSRVLPLPWGDALFSSRSSLVPRVNELLTQGSPSKTVTQDSHFAWIPQHSAEKNSILGQRECKSYLCDPNTCLGKLFQVPLTSTPRLSLQESKLLISRIRLWQLFTISIDMCSPLSTSEKGKPKPSDYTRVTRAGRTSQEDNPPSHSCCFISFSLRSFLFVPQIYCLL